MNRKFMNLVYSRKRVAMRPFITFRHLARARFDFGKEYQTEELGKVFGIGLLGGSCE